MEHRRNIDVIVETIAFAGKRVVDVGCGDGSLARHLARQGATVLGVECSPRQLAKARAAQPVAGVTIVAGVGQALPCPDAFADVVVFFNSLHHVPAAFMAPALAEAARVLVPGGVVYLSEPLPEGLFFAAVRPVDDETAVRAQALAAIQGAAAQGLEPAGEIRYVHTLKMDSYEAFRERIVSANAEREARFATLDTAMRALFAANATRTADGAYAFEQPMRINLLRKP
ncbi:MAG: class I SAM-dependent methyltransferase [Magnetospirillum sp.]|nr:class I SAM-dependent methyltransferase [Magnetospirillum sp.]